MSEQTIDRLQIEIDAKSNASADGMERLTASIERMLEATRDGLGGMSAVLDSITKMKTELSGMNSTVNGLSKMVNSLKTLNELNLTEIGSQITKFSNEAKNLSGIGESLASIKDFTKGMTSMKNGIGKINDLDLTNTAEQIKTLVAAVKPLTDEMIRGGSVANSYGTQLKEMAQAVKTMNGIKGSPQGLRASTSSINNKLGLGLDFAKLTGAVYAVERVGTTIAGFIQNTNSYIENMNLFSVAMGEAADEGERFAQTLQEALGIDAGEAMRNMGLFKNLTSSFGATSEQSTVLAKNLTQLGYDLSSFFNLSVDESFTKLQSGIAGEIEPLRRVGVDLSEARLQQELYNLGINQSVVNLTQADKALLRYIAIMKQTTSAQGDMARTIMTPANALRVLQAQLQVAGRAIGSIFVPALTAILPPAIAVVKVIGEAASALARFFGFEMPTIDYSSLTQMPTVEVSNDIDDITSSMDDYTDSVNVASKATKTLIGGFDELNILKSPTEASSSLPDASLDTGKAEIGSILGDIELPEYDMLLGGVESEIDEWVDKIKEAIGTATTYIKPFVPLLEGLGTAIAVAFAVKELKKFRDFMGELPGMNKTIGALKSGFSVFRTELKNTSGQMGKLKGFTTSAKKGLDTFRASVPTAVKAAVGIGGIAANFMTASNAIEAATLKTEGWETQLGLSVASFGVVEGLLFAFCGPWGAVAGAIAGALGALKGYNDAQEELRRNRMEEDFFDGTGIALETLTTMFEENTSHIQTYSDEVLKLKEQYDQNTESIRTSIGELDNFSNKLSLTGELTAEEASNMQKSFDTLVKNLQDNFSLNTQMIFEGFSNMSKQAAENLGVDVGEMTAILQGFQSRFNGITSGIKADVDAVINKAATGQAITQQEWDELSRNMSILSQVSSSVLGEKIKLLDASEELQGIDWGNYDQATQAISQFGEAAQSIYGEANSAYDAQIQSLEQMRASFQIFYENGLVSQEEMNGMMDFYGRAKEALDTSFNENKSKIDEQVTASIGYIQSSLSLEVESMIKKSTPTIWERLVASVGSYGAKDPGLYQETLDDYAKKAAEEVIQPIQDALNTEISNIRSISGTYDLGKKIIEEIGKGVEENDWETIRGIQSSCWEIITKVKETFGIDSPPSEFKNMGKKNIDDLGKGIEDNSKAVSACQESVDEILKTAKNTLSYEEFNKIGKEAVGGINDGLKGIEFPEIEVPHFEMNYNTIGYDAKAWRNMGLPGKPEVDVKWYARGGIFNSPQIIGVGESGREAVVPLEDNSPWIKALSENVSTQVSLDNDMGSERILMFIDAVADRIIEAIQENGNVVVQNNLDSDALVEKILVRKGRR